MSDQEIIKFTIMAGSDGIGRILFDSMVSDPDVEDAALNHIERHCLDEGYPGKRGFEWVTGGEIYINPNDTDDYDIIEQTGHIQEMEALQPEDDDAYGF